MLVNNPLDRKNNIPMGGKFSLHRKKYFKIGAIATLIIIFGFTGYFIGKKQEYKVLVNTLNLIRPIREDSAGYKFVDPLLVYLIPDAENDPNLKTLQNKITDIINGEKKNGLTDGSVFFYDLNRGRRIGINEHDKYDPASMLKVVIMVAYFKEAEIDPKILNAKFVFTKEINDSITQANEYSDKSNLEIGKEYAVDELINKMIIDSDNGAKNLLLNNIDSKYIVSIYDDLNIDNPINNNTFQISPRAYSLFFRILYNATYLSKTDSEKTLEILSKTTFPDGIRAGTPKDITVADKYGYYVDAQAKEMELHDCGIVYTGQFPYFLCIMTRGKNLDVLKNTIKDISSQVYEDHLNYNK